MIKILFIAPHRFNRSPSQRYRFEQYFDFFKQNNIQPKLSFIISEKDDAVFYGEGKLIRKLFIFLKSIFIRIKDWNNYSNYDIIFVQREALMIGSSFFERKIKNSKAKFIFDFDDAIWKLDTSAANKKWEWLKNPNKTKEIITASDLVIAGNSYLMNYALQFNSNVKLIPTTIDTDFHQPPSKKTNNDVITIGWSGSKTTIKHFESAIPVLLKLKEKYGKKIEFKVMGDDSFTFDELDIIGIAWSHNSEVDIINSFDIGIMPLPDDEWAKGKCGLKGISYMSCAIPTILSPVGVNSEIIKHGENGFLANTDEDWLNYLSLLIENAELRKKLGENARKTVEEKYSVEVNKHLYLKAIQEVLK